MSEQAETFQEPVKKLNTPASEFWVWWQKEFENPKDFMEYNVGSFKTAIEISKKIEDLIWPDFTVHIEGKF